MRVKFKTFTTKIYLFQQHLHTQLDSYALMKISIISTSRFRTEGSTKPSQANIFKHGQNKIFKTTQKSQSSDAELKVHITQQQEQEQRLIHVS